MIYIDNITATDVSGVVPVVSLDEVKDWLREASDDFDGLIMQMIKGATQTIERQLGWDLISKTRTMDFENTGFDDVSWPFPYAKGVSGVAISEIGVGDVLTPLVSGVGYFIRGSSLRVLTGKYAVTYTTVPGTIPEAIKEAIKMEVAERYAHTGENRNGFKDGVSQAAMDKISQYRIIWQ